MTLAGYAIRRLKTENVRLYGYKHIETGVVTRLFRTKGPATQFRNRICYQAALGDFSSVGSLPDDMAIVEALALQKRSEWTLALYGLIEITDDGPA